MDIEISDHADRQLSARCIPRDAIDFIVRVAHRERKTGAIFCQLRGTDLPHELPANHPWRRLVGTTLVLCKCGRFVITGYRNPKAFQTDRKKAKYNNRKHAPCPCCGFKHDVEDDVA